MFFQIFLAILSFVSIALLLSAAILLVKKKILGNGLCKIFINNKDELTKEVSSGSTLLYDLLQEGISIPSPCGGKATCKQCKVQVLAGGGPILDPDKGTFTPKELAEGWRLSCQCKVKEDLTLSIPQELLDVKCYQGKVLSNQNVATFIKELVIEIPKEESFFYQSGSYVIFEIPSFQTNTEDWKVEMDPIYFPDWEKYKMFGQQISFSSSGEKVTRAYSMASYPAEGNILKFTVRIATPPLDAIGKKPWGIGSSYLFSLKEGDRCCFSGPFGESFMRGDGEELVFLIGGAGSSFGRSHIMHLFQTEKTKRKVTLWYGARSLRENIYEKEFQELESQYPNFSYHLVLSDPLAEDFDKGWPKEDPCKTGFVYKAFEEGQLKKLENPDDLLYFVCGPPLHNISVMNLLDEYGVPREQIVLDDFGS